MPRAAEFMDLHGLSAATGFQQAKANRSSVISTHSGRHLLSVQKMQGTDLRVCPFLKTDLLFFRPYDVLRCRRSLCWPVWSRGVGELAVGVAVVMADPRHGKRQRVFIAPLGYEVTIGVGAD